MTTIGLISLVLAIYISRVEGLRNGGIINKLIVDKDLLISEQSCLLPSNPLTPQGRGVCIGLYQCPQLEQLVSKPKRTPQELDLLRKMHCGFSEDNRPKVCCPRLCLTPEWQPGQCVNVHSCHHIAYWLSQKPVFKETLAYVRNLRCDGLDEYSICCSPPRDVPPPPPTAPYEPPPPVHHPFEPPPPVYYPFKPDPPVHQPFEPPPPVHHPFKPTPPVTPPPVQSTPTTTLWPGTPVPAPPLPVQPGPPPLPLITNPEFPLPEPDSSTCISGYFPPDPSTNCCGSESLAGDRVFGGNATEIDQYPWLAVIEYRKDDQIKLSCGGVLISGRFVLTAAHCVTERYTKSAVPVNVRLGEYDTSNDGEDCVTVAGGGSDCTEGAIIVPIEKTIPHPEYVGAQNFNRHDIALIKLAQTVLYTDFIRPICLPVKDATWNFRSSTQLFVAGWGAVDERHSSSTIKQHVGVPYNTLVECQSKYRAFGRKLTLWEGQICAGGEKGKDSCKGDSGGPLMYEDEDTKIFQVIGIVSFGPKVCATENVPGVYTKVLQYDSWIRSQIQAHTD